MADPTRIVADASVLVADLFLDGEARAALDHVRRHSWTTLVASDPLLSDAETAIGDLGDPDLATDWRERIERDRDRVEHPPGDHPALASAYRGNAAHLLTWNEHLSAATTNLTIQPHADLSIRSPDAFARLFDPESLYREVGDGAYPGPDRDPRA